MISVIVPVYNTSGHLEECVSSIENQTYHDVEIILVNDGSTDGSDELCKKLVVENSNIVYIKQKNSGVSTARNNGIKAARGEWISFVDSDDSLDPYMFQKLLSVAKDGDDIICCCAFDCNERKKTPDFFFERSFRAQTLCDKEKLLCQLLYSKYGHGKTGCTAVGVPWGKLYRRTFINNKGLKFDPALRRMQDNVFNLNAFFHAEAIEYLNEPLYLYRLEHIEKKSYISLDVAKLVMDRRQYFWNCHPEVLTDHLLKANYDGEKQLFISILMNCGTRKYKDAKNELIQLSLCNEFRDLLTNDNCDNEKKFILAKQMLILKWYGLLALFLKLYCFLNKN